MKRLLLATICALFLGVQSASAQSIPGYEIVYSAPESGMLSLGYTCTITAYDASGQGLIAREVSMRIDSYVIWLSPVRSADYYVSFLVNGVRSWAIYNRATIDNTCH